MTFSTWIRNYALRTLVVYLGVVVVTVAGQGPGTHSDHFDPKYNALKELLVTPETHPGLFSFTGRWLKRKDVFIATKWPGTYVTTLVYGPKCSLRLRPLAEGIVNYSFLISIDGEPDRKVTISEFDSSAPESQIAFVPITLEVKEEGEVDRTVPPSQRVLKPHAVRFTSNPETPLRFDGVMYENTAIKQGLQWLEPQNKRLTVEFVGADIDVDSHGGITTAFTNSGEPYIAPTDALLKSIQWKAAESLKLRHSHIDSGVCLTNYCDKGNPIPGLEDQYFNEDPLNNTKPFSRISTIANTDARHPANFEIPWKFYASQPVVKFNPPSHVVIDTGVLDVLVYGVPAETFQRRLMVFLARMREQGYPDSRIHVIARKPTSSPPKRRNGENLELPGNIYDLRNQLFTATTNAVDTLRRYGDRYIDTVIISPSSNPLRDMEKALCRSIVPAPSLLSWASSSTSTLTPTQQRCKELNSLRASRYVEEYDASDVMWLLALLILAGGALYVARATLIGSIAAIVGRKRLGMASLSGNEILGDVDDSKAVYHVRKPTGDFTKLG